MSRSFLSLLLILTGILGMPVSLMAQRGLTEVPDPDPAKEQASFQVAKGFEVNLFASEPMISKPIQMNWDSQGRLWVATSETYPHIKPGQPASDKIIVLEDTDGDGVADSHTVFADGLLMPTAILPGDGGVYVGASTELLHLKDTNGDGKADQERIILSGFGTEDTHHMIHTLRRGPDGRIYFNQSIYTHSHLETPHGVRRLLAGGAWRLHPETMELEVYTRGLINPWGHVFDRWGQSFQTDGAGSQGIHYVFPDIVMATAYNAERTVPGLNPGQPKHCGLEILSGNHLPQEWQGRYVTNDFRGNRINSFDLTESGSGYVSRQADNLLTSNYVSFRPIDILMGPDGAIYVADWYNPIIQHGEVDFRDERRDQEHGRIWRIAPESLPKLTAKIPADCDEKELVELLRSDQKWWRDAARYELALRDPKSLQQIQEVKTLQEMQNADSQSETSFLNAQTQLELTWILAGQQNETAAKAQSLLSSSDHHLRAAGIRMLADYRHVDAQKTFEWIRSTIQDEHPQVRLEAVHALRKLGTAEAVRTCASAIPQRDAFLDFALWQTFRQTEAVWLPKLLADPEWLSADVEVLLFVARAARSATIVKPIAQLWQDGKISEEQAPAVLAMIAERGDGDDLNLLWQKSLASLDDTAVPLLQTLVQAAERRAAAPSQNRERISSVLKSESAVIRELGCRLVGLWKLSAERTSLTAFVEQTEQPQAVRQAALQSLASLGGVESRQLLISIAEGKHFPELRLGAVEALAKLDLKLSAKLGLQFLAEDSTQVDSDQVFNLYFSRKEGPAVLTDVLRGMTLPAEVAAVGVRRATSLPQKNPALVEAFQNAGQLGAVMEAMSPEKLNALREAVVRLGDVHRGEEIYRREKLLCLKCHAIGGAGGKVGPDLSSIGASAPVDYLIESLLEPSKKIKEGYHTLQVVTIDGLVKTGVPVLQNQAEIHLRDADGKIQVIATDDIEFSQNAPISLMPADLVSKLRRDELIDLVRFLSALGKTGELVVSKQRLVRTWQTIVPGDKLQPVTDIIRHHGPEQVAMAETSLPWETIYSHVDGELRTGSLTQFRNIGGKDLQFARFELEVTQAGKVGLQVNLPQGLMIWANQKSVPVAEQMLLDLPVGKHQITLGWEPGLRPAGRLRVELIDLPESTGQASLLN